MDKPILTVFTPAFNRAHTIHRTYESLLRQTCKDFVWLVIDDGSTDATKELVNGWVKENKIRINYHYKENGGMHTAHNSAYRLIDTELNTCIDSDDYMTDDSVELIVNLWKEKGGDQYAGIIGLDESMQDGNVIGTLFTKSETTLTEFYSQGGKGDKKLVYRTDIMKSLPEYPEFEGEKYVGLGWKYMLADLKYKMITINKVLIIVDYQLDGSSMNMYKQYFRNPKGFAFIRKEAMKHHPSFKRRFIEAIHYVNSSIISKNRNFVSESPQKLLTIVAAPFGCILYLYARNMVIKGRKMEVR
ncbi:glycosyltransferase family 2 protein [Saccharicrinis aurantiacus]|uniref:glycosyltransferase family 2 protein n=1 Tax=Saccharicrinis aurantiacus TaxID=1849719 RepID=UPI002490CF21|nr:glycosyltransferase family 2 protein [Saccharicrinis aurantiacus]